MMPTMVALAALLVGSALLSRLAPCSGVGSAAVTGGSPQSPFQHAPLMGWSAWKSFHFEVRTQRCSVCPALLCCGLVWW
jgi:hypothetical protein